MKKHKTAFTANNTLQFMSYKSEELPYFSSEKVAYT